MKSIIVSEKFKSWMDIRGNENSISPNLNQLLEECHQFELKGLNLPQCQVQL